ncbi:MAG: N-acyl-D-amino-acid deacylase [Candidatus Poriferisodalaceae bacterium]|jgi:N-acyl-D-amino-acid deacylase
MSLRGEIMHDVVIRGGRVVDGTGAAERLADVAIDDGVITAIGSDVGEGRRVIDAEGLLVTPGFVDVHTHYDGQATWDPELAPSSLHGVTTTVFGNCGVGFAPARPDEHEWLIQLMEGVEDIPGAALSEGITWNWETFPEYLDALEGLPRVMDIATQVPHGAVRAYVMGDRGARNEPATEEDLAAMAKIVEEGIRAGALGFTSSRTKLHRALDGEAVPGTFAGADEMVAMGRAVADAGGGVVEVASDIGLGGLEGQFGDDVDWMRELAANHGLTVTYALTQSDAHPDQWRELLDMSSAPIDGDGRVIAQIAGRPAGLLFGLRTSLHPFKMHPTFVALTEQHEGDALLAELAKPEVKAAILAETTGFTGRFNHDVAHGFHKMYPLIDDLTYEPDSVDSVAGRAEAADIDPYELTYDTLFSGDGQGLIFFPLTDFSEGSLNSTYERLQHHGAFWSLSDGGAHCRLICDASTSTYLLAYWARDRVKGPQLTIEEAVKLMTHDTAEVYGLLGDRGTLEVGKRADINVIDHAALALKPPKMINDLPADAPRLMQESVGYRATIVAGEIVRENDEFTGARPGRLVRGRR